MGYRLPACLLASRAVAYQTSLDPKAFSTTIEPIRAYQARRLRPPDGIFSDLATAEPAVVLLFKPQQLKNEPRQRNR
jgi:hypothetical protein